MQRRAERVQAGHGRRAMGDIWKKDISVEELTRNHIGTAVSTLSMEFLEVGDDFIRARVPVDERTRQPYGILHGGVSVVLAETLGSCGACHAFQGRRRGGQEAQVGAVLLEGAISDEAMQVCIAIDVRDATPMDLDGLKLDPNGSGHAPLCDL